jgi:hypothetical protein
MGGSLAGSIMCMDGRVDLSCVWMGGSLAGSIMCMDGREPGWIYHVYGWEGACLDLSCVWMGGNLAGSIMCMDGREPECSGLSKKCGHVNVTLADQSTDSARWQEANLRLPPTYTGLLVAPP